jgi:hypothetical protein
MTAGHLLLFRVGARNARWLRWPGNPAEITRETVTGILGGAGTDELAAADPVPAGSRLAAGSPIGVVTVPAWRPGLAQSVLPSSYRDLLEVLEVLADAGWPLRAGGIAAAAGPSTDRSKVLHGRFIPWHHRRRGWTTQQYRLDPP